MFYYSTTYMRKVSGFLKAQCAAVNTTLGPIIEPQHGCSSKPVSLSTKSNIRIKLIFIYTYGNIY